MKHLGTKELSSNRLILRRIKEEDAKEIFEGFVNQKEFLYYANKKKRTLEEEKESLKGIDEKYKKNNYYNWIITLKDNGKIIGSINVMSNDLEEYVEFNYAIDNRYVNKGYMSEALNRIIVFFFEEVGVKKIIGGCCIENIASKRVMEKNKMICIGTIKDYIQLSDRKHDMYRFVLINQCY